MRAKETTLLGNLAKIRTGKLDANASSDNGKYPFFTCAKNPLRINQYTYDCECILIAGNGDLNAKYYKGKFDAYQRTYIIEPTSNLINCKFLFYFLDTYLEELRRLSIGGVIKYIKLQNLTEAKIPLPPIDEQRRIAEIFEKHKQINIKNKKRDKLFIELKESFYLSLFGSPISNPYSWPIKSLDQLSESRLGKMLDKKKETGKFLRPYLRNANVRWFEFDLRELSETDIKDDELSKYSVSKDDVLICEGGEPGRAAVWGGGSGVIGYQKALHRVRVDKKQIKSNYLCWYLWFMSKRGGFSDFVSKATIAHLTGVQLKKLPVPIPPLKLQHKFDNFLVMINKIEKAQNTTETELLSLNESLKDVFIK